MGSCVFPICIFRNVRHGCAQPLPDGMAGFQLAPLPVLLPQEQTQAAHIADCSYTSPVLLNSSAGVRAVTLPVWSGCCPSRLLVRTLCLPGCEQTCLQEPCSQKEPREHISFHPQWVELRSSSASSHHTWVGIFFPSLYKIAAPAQIQ